MSQLLINLFAVYRNTVPFTGADGLGTPVRPLAPGATFGWVEIRSKDSFFFFANLNDIQPQYLVNFLYGFRSEVTNEVFFITSLCIYIFVPLSIVRWGVRCTTTNQTSCPYGCTIIRGREYVFPRVQSQGVRTPRKCPRKSFLRPDENRDFEPELSDHC